MQSLIKLSRYLGIKEFVIAFFVMTLASSLPNIFLGINAISSGMSSLALGDIFGNNLVVLTVAISFAVFFSRKKEIQIESTTIKDTSVFTIVSAILPVILLFDGNLSRIDGIILVLLFILYVFWLFSKKERFSKVYGGVEYKDNELIHNFKGTLLGLLRIIFGLVLVIVASKGIIHSANFFSFGFGLNIAIVGLFVTGIGNALPETYFAIASARKGHSFMILGNLMGSVIFLSTLVLGILAITSPIDIKDGSFLVLSRIFMIISAVLFWVFGRTSRKIEKKEAVLMFLIYIIFAISFLISYIHG